MATYVHLVPDDLRPPEVLDRVTASWGRGSNSRGEAIPPETDGPLADAGSATLFRADPAVAPAHRAWKVRTGRPIPHLRSAGRHPEA